MLSCIQGQRQAQMLPGGLSEWFFWFNCPKLCYPFGSEFCGTKLTFRTASMTTRTLLLQCTACMSMGVLLGCALWLHPLAAQSSAKDDGTNSITMSSPSENPQGNGGIDYKNAKPMPLPSVPGPTPWTLCLHPPLQAIDRDLRGVFQAVSGLGSNTPRS